MKPRRRAALTTGILVVFLCSLALPATTAGSPMLLEWSATIGFVSTNPIPQLPSTVEVGDIISGSFVYDTDTAPSSISDVTAWYHLASAWTLTIDGRTYSGNGFQAFVDNDSPFDELFIQTTPSTNDPDFQFSYTWDFRDLHGMKWDSLSLPGAFTAQGFDASFIVVTRHDTEFIDIFGQPTVGDTGVLSANHPSRLRSLTVRPVPEPSTLLLLAAALPAASALRRRTH